MNEMNLRRIGVVLLVLGFVSFIILAVLAVASPYHIEKVSCYDEYRNKMVGLDCEDRVIDDPTIYLWILPAFFLAFIGVVILN